MVVARTPEELRHKADTALVAIDEWLRNKKLSIASEKTELVPLSGRRKLKELTVTVGETRVKSIKSTKYLGVYLDKDMRMTEHVMRVVERANEITTKLARLMPNIGGPRASKRRVMAGAVMSVVLYGAPVWAEALRHARYRLMLEAVQRKLALRISSAYRTVSLEAAQVMSGLVPVDILVRERKRVYHHPEERAGTKERALTE